MPSLKRTEPTVPDHLMHGGLPEAEPSGGRADREQLNADCRSKAGDAQANTASSATSSRSVSSSTAASASRVSIPSASCAALEDDVASTADSDQVWVRGVPIVVLHGSRHVFACRWRRYQQLGRGLRGSLPYSPHDLNGYRELQRARS